MSTNRGYLVVPKLVKQPTWGGYYIAKIKGWSNASFGKTKIGQSYELYSGTHLSLATDTTQEDFQPEIDELPDRTLPLSQLILLDPQAALGKNNIDIFGSGMKTLIKFTQAKGNSFQIHVKPGTENTNWQPKPESWYYFEDGRATLGLSDPANLDQYKQACITIDKYVASLAKSVTDGQITPEDARTKIQSFISGQNIYQYVNTVDIPKDSVVDLSAGGTHHSWEEDDKKIPLGNILYEVQMDVMDNVSTIRSFDKGKIQDDGSIRELQIEDYFVYVERTQEANNPDTLMTGLKQVDKQSEYSVFQVFDTRYYKLQKIEISNELSNDYTSPHDISFHHLFVKSGAIEYNDHQVQLSVGTGHSVFVPANVAEYSLKPTSHEATVLKTYV